MSNQTPTPEVSEGLIPSTQTIGARLLGPNYKVRIAGYIKAFNDLALYLALAPYALEGAGILMPAFLKAPFFFFCSAAKFYLTIRQANLMKQKDVNGSGEIGIEVIDEIARKVLSDLTSPKVEGVVLNQPKDKE